MSEQITAEQAEAHVRERWNDCGSASPIRFAEHWQVWCGNNFFSRDSQQECWLSAYAYTKAHERKIAEKREEIVLVGEMATIPQGMMELYAKKGLEFSLEFIANREIAQRILAILEAQLAELLKGWRQS